MAWPPPDCGASGAGALAGRVAFLREIGRLEGVMEEADKAEKGAPSERHRPLPPSSSRSSLSNRPPLV